MALSVHAALNEIGRAERERIAALPQWYWYNDRLMASKGPYESRIKAYTNHPPVLQPGWYLLRLK